jgi:aryl-alcohol dehydrogenase-like predicted oxidoreductase
MRSLRYVSLGRGSGLRVSEYGLGTANFGSRWGAGATRDESRRIFERFAEAGGNFIDTADCYQFGESEEFVGELIAGQRDQFVLATKYTLGASSDPKVALIGNSRKSMVRSLEGSLRRLGTDYVDVLCVHTPDSITAGDEIARGFDDLVRAGKIMHGALSNFPAWRAARMATVSELRGWSPLAAVQVEYSLADRGAERDLIPMAEAFGLALMLWSPLGGGLLTGKYRQGEAGRLTDWNFAIHREDTVRKTAVIDALLSLSAELGATPAQVAMAWLLERGSRMPTGFVPLVGPRNLLQLDEYLGALDIKLSEEQSAKLNEVSALRLGVPHDTAAGDVNGALGGDGNRVRRPPVPVV